MYRYNDKIGIIGLGKLGLPMLSAFIKRGFNPIGYDINQDLINLLQNKKNPYNENGLQDIIDNDKEWENRFYSKLNLFIQKISTVFLIVPTPTKNKIFDISFLDNALSNIANEIKQSKQEKLNVVITSTVNPGDCENFYSKYSAFFNLVYSPEFIALGSVLQDMLHPDVVLLGGKDVVSIDKIFSIYNRLYESHPEYHRLNFIEAETAKIGINTFVTTKISYANSIGMFIENATDSRESAQRVLDAIGGDSRVGRKYFKYGVGYGGPCFPRDNRALGWHLEKSNIPSFIPKATDDLNNAVIDYWINKIKIKSYDAIVSIGIAYKPNTDFIEESFMIKLLSSLNIPVFYSDDLVNNLNKIEKITLENHFEKLKDFKNVGVLINYGKFCFDNSLKNLDLINIWN